MMRYITLFLPALLLFSPVHFLEGKNLVADGGFEEKGTGKQTKFSSAAFKKWIIRFNGIQNGEGSVAEGKDVFAGKYALRLVNKKAGQLTSADSVDLVKVTPGETVTASIRHRGTGGAHLHFYFYDQNKKRLRKSFGDGAPSGKNWKLFSTRFKVPSDVAYIRFSVWVLRKANVCFDNAHMTVSRSGMLENKVLRIRLNPSCGGVVESLIVKKGGRFDYTLKNTMQIPGGLFADILPGNTMPGYFRNSIYTLKESTSQSAVLERKDLLRRWQIRKTYVLDRKKPLLRVRITITNLHEKERIVRYRIQNILSPGKGVFSWPGTDWIHAFRSTGKAPGTLNSIHIPKLGSPWAAKTFEKEDHTLKFGFETDLVRKCYTYLADNCSTLEWYYSDKVLPGGKSLTFNCSLEVLNSGKSVYKDEKNKKMPVEYIIPKALPSPGMKKPLPPGMKNFFPYMASTGIPMRYEAVSGLRNTSRQKNYAVTSLQVADDFTRAYFNSLYSPLILSSDWSKDLWVNGKNELCETLAARKMKLIPTRLLLNRTHIDPAKYKLNVSGLKRSKHFRQLWKQYGSLMPCVFTADEIEGKNVEVMLKAHEILRSVLPEDCLLFPYVCAPNTELIDYVPVFLGDWYPINRAGKGGRNPWSVKSRFDAVMRKAKDTPVWIMPQGFGCVPPSIYSFPTDGEIKLMLHLAVAAGVKGVVFHGFPNVGWNWVNNQYYDYAFYGGAAQTTPQWKAISSCGEILTAAGSLLCRTRPGALPGDFTVTSPTYKAPGGYYQGPAVRAYGLVNKEFTIAVCVNMDPYQSVTGKVSFGKNKVYDLRKMRKAHKDLVLAPGQAAYFLLNGSEKLITEVFRNRCEREEARLHLLQTWARAARCTAVKTPSDSLPAGKRYQMLLKSHEQQQKIIASSAAGKIHALIPQIEKLLFKADFLLCTYGNAFRKKKVPEHGRKLAKEILFDFRGLNRLKLERRKGFAPDSFSRAEALLKKVKKDHVSLLRLDQELKKSSIYPDDPYK